MLDDDNDHFWSMYNEQHDYDYFMEHQDTYGTGGGKHPVYWTVVSVLVLIAALAFPSSPGVPIFIFMMALSGSFCL